MMRRRLISISLLVMMAGCAKVDMTRVGAEMGLDPGVTKALAYANRAAVAMLPISDAEERKLGRAVAGQVIARFGIEKDAGRTYYLNLIGHSLARHSSRPQLPYRFAILATDDINAYACPGGYIFVTRGAMNMVRDESELAAVLAHEISHVTERHITRELQKSNLLNVGIDALKDAFDTESPLFDKMTDFATNLLFNGLKQEDEFGSDSRATLYLSRTGYDYPAIFDLLSMLRSRSHQATILTKTHPSPDERIRQLRTTLPSLGLQPPTGIRIKPRFERYTRS